MKKALFALPFLILAPTSYASPHAEPRNLNQNLNQNLKWNARILEVHSGAVLSISELAEGLSQSGTKNIVLGEIHYNPPVQQAEADIMRSFIAREHSENHFTTAWEFLETASDSKVQSLFESFVSGALSGDGFIQGIFNRELESPYLPMLEVPKDLGGQLLSTNLSHEQKDPVVQGGLSKIDPSLIPPHFAMGDQNYYDRFSVAMQGHATQTELANYFAAQCLTDDVIAYNLVTRSTQDIRFLVVGSFHTDYKDGVIARLKARAPSEHTQVIRFFDISTLTQSQVITELPAILNHSMYGDIADYVYFVNEPASDPTP